MPQLPSGRYIAIQTNQSLQQMLGRAWNGTGANELTAIEQIEDLYPYTNVLFLTAVDNGDMQIPVTKGSLPLPPGMQIENDEHTLATIATEMSDWIHKQLPYEIMNLWMAVEEDDDIKELYTFEYKIIQSASVTPYVTDAFYKNTNAK